MSHPWASFLASHATLRRQVTTACGAVLEAEALDEAALRREVGRLHALLSHGVLRHMAVEERVLYPALARTEGQMSVELMTTDHRTIADLEREVARADEALSHDGLTPAQRRQLVRTMYALASLVDLHMAKEEEICLPALDRKLEAGLRHDLEEGLETFELAEQLAE
jgi:iron-sulfur cluster repair protein YtfE (RIC family)